MLSCAAEETFSERRTVRCGMGDGGRRRGGAHGAVVRLEPRGGRQVLERRAVLGQLPIGERAPVQPLHAGGVALQSARAELDRLRELRRGEGEVSEVRAR